MNATPPVRRDEAARRFQLDVEGETAWLDYRVEGERLLLVYTEVPPRLRNRGLGGVLVEAALAWAAEEGLEAVPLCGYVRAYLRRRGSQRAAGAVD